MAGEHSSRSAMKWLSEGKRSTKTRWRNSHVRVRSTRNVSRVDLDRSHVLEEKRDANQIYHGRARPDKPYQRRRYRHRACQNRSSTAEGYFDSLCRDPNLGSDQMLRASPDAGIVSASGRSVAVNLNLPARAKRADRRSIASPTGSALSPFLPHNVVSLPGYCHHLLVASADDRLTFPDFVTFRGRISLL